MGQHLFPPAFGDAYLGPAPIRLVRVALDVSAPRETVHDPRRRGSGDLEAASDLRGSQRLGDEVTLLRVLLHTTEATRLPGTLEQRLVDTEVLFDIAKRLGDPVLLGVAAVREVRVKIEAAAFDQVDDALAVLDEVAHLDPYVRSNRPSLHAVLAQVRGDFPTALAFADEARVAGGAEPFSFAPSSILNPM